MWVESTYIPHKGKFEPVETTFTIEKERVVRLAKSSDPEELIVYVGSKEEPDPSKVPPAIHKELVECLD